MWKRYDLLLLMFLAVLLPTIAVRADDDGQDVLDKAIDLKLKATTLDELNQVVTLCEEAISKGLNPHDESFAKDLLIAAVYQRLRPQVDMLTKLPQLPPQLQQRRDEMLDDVRKILSYDDRFGYAYLMRAKLQALAGGDRQEARQASDRAVELLTDDQEALAEAYLVRGQLQEDEEARIADFDRAAEANPDDPEVWQTRAFYFLLRGNAERAIEDFNRLLEKDSDNLLARMAIADTLLKLDKLDEAMKHVNLICETRPNVMAYKLRAQLWALQEQWEKARADIEQAMQLDADDLELYLMRARLYYLEDRNALALSDVRHVLEASPDNPAALELRSSIQTAMGQFEDALQDIGRMLQRDPDNLRYRMQRAILLNASERSREAIEVFTKILQDEPGNIMALRGRGDAYLNTGAHREAIADYEVLLKSDEEDSGTLNNFAWVLATSPDDDLRNGQRAVELALKACELTEYEAAHILSTLAAAYAEVGDFDNAVKWSQKACEIGDESIQEQLRQELESYQQKKPWRERKVEEEPEEEEKEAAEQPADEEV